MTKTPHYRRARQALLWAGVIFCLVQFGTTLLLDRWWLDVRYPALTDNLGAMEAMPRSPEVVCLGSSRLGYAFHEQTIRESLRQLPGSETIEVYNASLAAADLITADLLMQLMLERGIHPGLVVIEVNPETLAHKNSWIDRNARQHWTWSDIPANWRDLKRESGLDDLIQCRTIPVHAYREGLRTKCLRSFKAVAAPELAGGRINRVKSKSSTGGLAWESRMFKRRELSKNSATERTRATLPYFRCWLLDYRLGDKATAGLERLIERCQQHGMDVCLVAPPVSSFHRELYTPEVDSAFLGHMAHVTKQHHCRFVDHRNHIPDELFQDNHHVTEEGGLRFSRELAEQVLAPLWQARVRGSKTLATTSP